MILKLIEETQQIIQLAEDITKKKFQFIEKEDLYYFAQVKPARKHMPYHLVFYKSKYNELINHLIAHECSHIIRMFSVSEADRLIPITDDATKKNAFAEIGSDINKISLLIPLNELNQIMNMWYSGTINQVTNQPPDLMIEKWIYDEYPNLRELQLQSINKQYEEAVMGLSGRVSRITPKKIFEASNIMNYCFYKYLDVYIKTNYSQAYADFKYKQKGEELAKITQKYNNDYHGDIKMITKWAEYLSIVKWFDWTDFENVPLNYESML